MRLFFAAASLACLVLVVAHPQAQHEKHWGYADGPETVGPAHWGDLAGDKVCGVGKEQSPIALVPPGTRLAAPTSQPALAFAYRASPLSMVNNGHTVQMNVDAGSSVTEAGATYRLAQYHFHSPSEHTLEGKSYPLEVHLVHLDAAGNPALVVGVFIEQGAANDALALAFAKLPAAQDEKSAPQGATVDPTALLPAKRDHYAYGGSLTTPPCTEGIRWRVMRTPITMSAAQIAAFRALPHLNHTARPVQAADGRTTLFVLAP